MLSVRLSIALRLLVTNGSPVNERDGTVYVHAVRLKRFRLSTFLTAALNHVDAKDWRSLNLAADLHTA
jgi:hypothetical protein